MAYLEKGMSVFARDNKGELLPVEATLKELGDARISFIPLTKGELLEIASKIRSGTNAADVDAETISSHLKNPTFTLEEAKNMKAYVSNSIIAQMVKVSCDIPNEVKPDIHLTEQVTGENKFR